VTYLADKKGIVEHLLHIISPGDLVITLGAGDIWQISEELVNRL
jgi:UDP-N-acetylmuramate--alanine ligase